MIPVLFVKSFINFESIYVELKYVHPKNGPFLAKLFRDIYLQLVSKKVHVQNAYVPCISALKRLQKKRGLGNSARTVILNHIYS